MYCQSGAYCIAKTSSGPALANQPLCHGCVEWIQAQLDELPTILSVLPAWKGGLRGQSGEAKVSTGERTPPTPLDIDVVDLEIFLKDLLSRVEGLRVVDLQMHSDGPKLCAKIRKAYSRADRIIGISRHFSRRHANCPTCDQRSLGSWAGEDVVSCRGCGLTLTLEEYSKWCLHLARS